ncbi:MAG: DUF72 domain-containing protein [Candidatus Acidiferrales bacterium]
MIYAGTSGWAYPAWKPAFYPAKLASAKFLGYYAGRLNSTEVNYTFRRFPTEKLLCNWADAALGGFKFAIKAHQSITHTKRLQDAGDSTKRFLSALQPLYDSGKLGPVLFQLPPFLKCDAARLREFLAELPKAYRTAFEFRHESWFCDEVYSILRGANAALCLAESEKLDTPKVRTADFSYLRLRNPKKMESAAERKKLLGTVAGLAGNGDVFAYFKHEDSPEGALHAEELLRNAKT